MQCLFFVSFRIAKAPYLQTGEFLWYFIVSYNNNLAKGIDIMYFVLVPAQKVYICSRALCQTSNMFFLDYATFTR